MSVEHTFYCDGPECPRHITTQQDTPPVFLVVSEQAALNLHFCGWDCLLRHAGTKEPEEVIEP